MKRQICLILSFLCLFSCIKVAIADQYVIHNGVSFGDSKNEVLEKEKSAGLLLEEHNSSEVIICPYHSILWKMKTKIAGYDDANLFYHFDSNDKLVSCVYALYSSKIKDDVVSNFNSVNSMLMTKYGENDVLLNTAITNDYLDICAYHQQDSIIEGMKGFATVETLESNSFSVLQDNGDVVAINICIRELNLAGIMLYNLYINYALIDSNTYNTTINSMSFDGQKAYDDL